MVFGSNCVLVELKVIQDIIAFSKQLQNKPKILILQACQGDKILEARPVIAKLKLPLIA